MAKYQWDGVKAKDRIASVKDEIDHLSTSVVDVDYKAQSAVVHAVLKFKNGQVFEATGHGGPDNLGSQVKIHFVTMAETRAISRAINLYLGETSDSDSQAEEKPAKSSRKFEQDDDDDSEDSEYVVCEECGDEIGEYMNKPGSYWAEKRRKESGQALCGRCINKWRKENK